MTDAFPCHIHLFVCLWFMDPHSRAPKKNTSHANEVLLQYSTHLIQRPCHQWESLCQDPAGNRTPWRPPDHHKEMQTAEVWSCLPYTRSGQNHFARHSERRKKTNIREWTGLEFTKSQKAMENRENWRKLVMKSSVVPQRPSWLRDSQDERERKTISKTTFSQTLLFVFLCKQAPNERPSLRQLSLKPYSSYPFVRGMSIGPWQKTIPLLRPLLLDFGVGLKRGLPPYSISQ